MKNVFTLIIFVLFATGLITNAQGQNNTRVDQFNIKKGVAIQGYDPVAYFTEGKAVKGDEQFAASVNGVTYHCSSLENKKLLLAKPQKYEPQYGGWCAYAMGDSGDKVKIDPETFKIIDGKLYLFYHTFFSNTLKKWNKNESTLNAKADKNWETIFK